MASTLENYFLRDLDEYLLENFIVAVDLDSARHQKND